MTHNSVDPIELDWLKRWSVYSPRRVALKCADSEREMDYGRLYVKTLNLAAVLKERFHIQPGDRVACMAQNDLEWVPLFFAVQRLGAILVPINFRFTAREVDHVVKDSGSRLLITQDEFANLCKALNETPRLWSFDGSDSVKSVCESDLTRPGAEPINWAGEFEKPCMILYTSGTTGFPKGAMITPKMMFWNSVTTGLRLNLTQSEVVLTFLPLFHTGGWNVLTTPCLHRGAKIVMLKKFDADKVLSLSNSEKATLLFGVPTTMDMLSRSPLFAETDLSSIRYAIVGGEPMPLELIETWEKKGIPIRQGFGLTEFGPNCFSLNEEDSKRKMGSIGFPNFYVEARVVDNSGFNVAAGEVGELILRGPQIMAGYWNNPKATAETIRDGWLYTGDLVKVDSEGYFYVVGRKKEMYISGGENVYPAEVEKVIRQLPDVAEVAVIGVPHPKWGESGRAFVTLKRPSSLSESRLKEHCLANLAKFKVPLEFLFLEELPKTDSGKISKRKLNEPSERWSEPTAFA